MIPYGRQSIDAADEAAVLAALRSDFLTQGPAVPAFEASLRAATAGSAVRTSTSSTSIQAR